MEHACAELNTVSNLWRGYAVRDYFIAPRDESLEPRGSLRKHTTSRTISSTQGFLRNRFERDIVWCHLGCLSYLSTLFDFSDAQRSNSGWGTLYEVNILSRFWSMVVTVAGFNNDVKCYPFCVLWPQAIWYEADELLVSLTLVGVS